MGYAKLFSSIITSTIWLEDDSTRIVWITMLALADKNGEVQGSVPGLARMAGVSHKAAQAALTKFLKPDADSRTKDLEGRRIEEIDGGWSLINYAKYRRMASVDESKEKNAERQKRYRERKAAAKNDTRVERDDTALRHASETHSDGDTTLRNGDDRNAVANSNAPRDDLNTTRHGAVTHSTDKAEAEAEAESRKQKAKEESYPAAASSLTAARDEKPDEEPKSPEARFREYIEAMAPPEMLAATPNAAAAPNGKAPRLSPDALAALAAVDETAARGVEVEPPPTDHPPDQTPAGQAFATYQLAAKLNGWPDPGYINSHVRWLIDERIKDVGLPGISQMLAKAANAAFLREPDRKTPKTFVRLQWLMESDNFMRIMEGSYEKVYAAARVEGPSVRKAIDALGHEIELAREATAADAKDAAIDRG